MFNFSKKYFIGFFCIGILLSACVLPENEDPFERLPEDKIETIRGEIFPFSVSVSTRATHRLEKDEKLQAYLASKVVRLEDFEGRDVEVDGVFRTEKMRPIFWVEKIRLKDIEKKKEEEEKDLIFETKKFRFIYSKNWEYTTAPNGMAYFLNKTDLARRVFLTFSVEDISDEDKKLDPNILIANLAGTKDVTQDNLGREREKLILFSNLYEKKYTFIFTHTFEEFEKKKSFFKLLNSFVEGEANIQKIKDKELKELAEKEKEKLDEEALAAEALSAQKEETRKESEQEVVEKSGSILDKLFGKTEESVEEKEEAITDTSQAESVVVKSGEFENLIDEKAFSYQSVYYKFSMKVPYGFWFRNFGQNEEAITEIGFSDQDFSRKSGAKFWLRILGDQTPPTEVLEKIEGDRVILQIPRSEKSFFELSGPVEFRDVMWSIVQTIEKF